MKLLSKSFAGKTVIVHKEVNQSGKIEFDVDGLSEELSGNLEQVQSIAGVIDAEVVEAPAVRPIQLETTSETPTPKRRK